MVWLMDGGFGSHIMKHYVGDEIDSGKLWSALFNVTRPEAVLATHRDFLLAGADLIRTNTYQASIVGYKKYLGLSDEESVGVLENSVELAFQARSDYYREHPNDQREIRVLASIGPYGAWLGDGSEYTGLYGDTVTDKMVKSFHKDRLDVILRKNVDGLAIETIPTQREAELIVDLLNEFYPSVKFWVSFSCKDDHSLVHGENFKAAVDSVWDRANDKTNILAIGVNCLDPKFVAPLLGSIGNGSRLDQIPLVAYPNSGEVYDATKKQWMSSEECPDFIYDLPKWIELGAKYVGGCCRNDANQIARMRSLLGK